VGGNVVIPSAASAVTFLGTLATTLGTKFSGKTFTVVTAATSGAYTAAPAAPAITVPAPAPAASSSDSVSTPSNGYGSLTFASDSPAGCSVSSTCVLPGWNYIYDAQNNIAFSSAARLTSCASYVAQASSTESVTLKGTDGSSVSASLQQTSPPALIVSTNNNCKITYTVNQNVPAASIFIGALRGFTLTAGTAPQALLTCFNAGYHYLIDGNNNVALASQAPASLSCDSFVGTLSNGKIQVTGSTGGSLDNTYYLNIVTTPTATTTGVLSLTVGKNSGQWIIHPMAVTTTTLTYAISSTRSARAHTPCGKNHCMSWDKQYIRVSLWGGQVQDRSRVQRDEARGAMQEDADRCWTQGDRILSAQERHRGEIPHRI
jgi:hypothetical protein